jgi:hypothetical protein
MQRTADFHEQIADARHGRRDHRSLLDGTGTAGVSCAAALESTEAARASLPRAATLGGAVVLVITVHCGATHNAIDRKKLFMMKAFHHPSGSQLALLTELAHLYNLAPYQRRAQHAGRCGVEVECGRLQTRDWFLNLQILTSGGFQRAAESLHYSIWGNLLFVTLP